MGKKNNRATKIATYGAMLAVLSGTIATPVSAATQSNNTNLEVENIKPQTGDGNTYAKSAALRVKPANISGITWGKMSYSGSAARGLQVTNGSTYGELSFKLDVTSLASVSLNDKTYFRVKLPEEFRKLAQTSAFRDSLSGRFEAWNLGFLKVKDVTYNPTNIKVDPSRNEILFENPRITGIGLLGKTTMTMTANLGQAINQSGVRIMDSSDSYYHFQSALSSGGNIIDWTIGSRESKVDIPLRQMDPGANVPDNTRPEINTSHVQKTISLNSKFTDSDALQGVTAFDKEDGDVTDKVRVISNNVNTRKVGNYTVVYSVTDSKGLEGQASVVFQVIDDAPAKDYTLNPAPYNLGDKGLIGSHGKDIYHVSLLIDGQYVSEARMTDGSFLFDNVNKFIVDKSHVVEIVGSDANYQERARKIISIGGEVKKDYSLTPNSYKIGDTNLTGTYGKDVSKVRLFINGSVVAQASTNKGEFVFKNANKFIKNKNQRVEVVAVDGSYKERNRKTVNVNGDSVKDFSLAANSYKIGDTNLTGTYGKDVSKVRLFINGSVVAQASTNKGEFVFKNANKFIKNKNQRVEVVAVDNTYKEQNRKTVSVYGESTKDYSLTANTYTLGTSLLTGTYGKDVSKVRLFVNGKVVSQATLNNGSYTFKNTDKFVTENEDMIQVKAVNSQYEEVNSINVNTNGSIVHDYKLTADDYTVGDAKETGTAGKDICKVRIRVNGQIVKQADLENGTYVAKGLKGLIKEGDLVEAVGVNNQYKEKAATTIRVFSKNVNHDYSLTAPNSYLIGTDSIEGTYGKDIKSVRLLVNGRSIKNADMNSSTKRYILKGLKYSDIRSGDLVKVVGLDSNYKQQVEKTIIVFG